MLKYLNIEFFKLRNTRYFWVLLICFLFFLLAVPIGTKMFVDFLGAQGENFMNFGFSIDQLPLFDFVDIWQNLTWVYEKFSILLGFIIVISVCNEFSYGTVKQNVIDGLSRRQFLFSKVGFIVGIAALASVFVLVVGIIFGLLWSPVQGLPFMFKNIEFIPAYFVQLIGFQLFCLLMALLIKRSGFVIALLIFYVYVIEPIVGAIIRYQYDLPWVADLLPINGITGIIPLPFSKYALMETQTYVGLGDAATSLAYVAIFFFASLWIIEKRDLA